MMMMMITLLWPPGVTMDSAAAVTVTAILAKEPAICQAASIRDLFCGNRHDFTAQPPQQASWLEIARVQGAGQHMLALCIA
jgi:hypothetical protein